VTSLNSKVILRTFNSSSVSPVERERGTAGYHGSTLQSPELVVNATEGAIAQRMDYEVWRQNPKHESCDPAKEKPYLAKIL